MEVLLLSAGVVALAELGDKTQLLAFLLAARFKKPVPIVFGILLATAGALGAWFTQAVPPEILRWALGVSLLGMAIWALIPDRIDAGEIRFARRSSIFMVTFLAFFLAEMGDKTQVATMVLAARHSALYVIAGTTLGMLLADVPAVFAGERLAKKLPLKWFRRAAAALFALLGIATLMGAGASLGV
ncbi:MAG: TMEM165/GDT1 family protein [Zoogloeaceae bacterium]|jgi:putative Ca2+/H+ antiporter (TMEM165/GDT1 family)|nr:TMEM165/GDT1 family protein [Zoogloeaceae bacterium]